MNLYIYIKNMNINIYLNEYIYIHMCIFILNINFIDLFHIYIYIFFCQLVSQGIRDASKSILANHPTARHLTEMQQPVRIRLTATAKPKAMSKHLDGKSV